MEILYCPQANTPWHEYGILIPLEKSRAEIITNKLGPRAQIIQRESVTLEDLKGVHASSFVKRLESKDSCQQEIIRAYELINSDGSYNRYDPSSAQHTLDHLLKNVLANCSGTYEAFKRALDTGAAFFLGGGLHHARSNRGAGFCLVNDIAIGLNKLGIKKALIVDVDAHRGDGTAEMLKSPHYTLSLHMADSYPFGEADLEQIPGTKDIGFKEGEEGSYLDKLNEAVTEAYDDSYELAVIVDGADPYEGDALPSTQKMKLTLDQLLQRDLFLYHFFKDRNCPQAYVMAGGYGKESYKVYLQFLEAL